MLRNQIRYLLRLLLREYDTILILKLDVFNTNANCLIRFPKQAFDYEFLLPDWNKGDYNLSSPTVFALMSTKQLDKIQLLQLEIWENLVVL